MSLLRGVKIGLSSIGISVKEKTLSTYWNIGNLFPIMENIHNHEE